MNIDIRCGVVSCALVLASCVTAEGEQLAAKQESLIATTSTVAIGPVQLEDFYVSGTDNGDWAPAFNRFLTTSTSSKVVLSCDKNYEVRSTVNICRPVTIEGCGNSTHLLASTGITAFAVRYADYCNAGGVSGAKTQIKSLFLEEVGQGNTVRYGILLEARAHLEDLWIWRFSNAVRIDADVNRAGTAKSNANSWSMDRVHINYSEHAGVLVKGGDSNIGVATNVMSNHTCWHANKSMYAVGPEFPVCAGILDSSFLGNTWINPSTADTGLSDQTVQYASFRFEGAGNSVCIGCYAESGQLTGELGSNSVAVGGNAPFAGGGIALLKGEMTNITIRAPLIAPKVGDTDPTPAVMSFQASGSGSDKLVIEQNGASSLRGSWKGANANVGWRWYGSPPSFQAVP